MSYYGCGDDKLRVEDLADCLLFGRETQRVGSGTFLRTDQLHQLRSQIDARLGFIEKAKATSDSGKTHPVIVGDLICHTRGGKIEVSSSLDRAHSYYQTYTAAQALEMAAALTAHAKALKSE